MAEKKSDIELDLDALAPPKVEIKYQGKVINVEPPDLEQYAKIIDYSNQLQTVGKGVDNFKELQGVYDKINAFIVECIPEFKDVKLNMAQLSSLFKLLSEIGAPTDRAVAKLKEQGINLKPKKASSPKVSASRKQ